MSNKKLIELELKLEKALFQYKKNDSEFSDLIDLLNEYCEEMDKSLRLVIGNTIMGGLMTGTYFYNGAVSNSELIHSLLEIIKNPSSISNFDNMPLYLWLLIVIFFKNAYSNHDERKFLKKVLKKNNVEIIHGKNGDIMRIKK